MLTFTRKQMILCCLLAVFFACTSDQLINPDTPIDECTESVTYDVQIKTIIETYCALSGCHVSGGDGPGDYSTYESMAPFLSANFKNSVIDLKDDPINGMPPDWDANPGPKDLTDEDFDLMKCWIEQGFPEN